MLLAKLTLPLLVAIVRGSYLRQASFSLKHRFQGPRSRPRPALGLAQVVCTTLTRVCMCVSLNRASSSSSTPIRQPCTPWYVRGVTGHRDGLCSTHSFCCYGLVYLLDSWYCPIEVHLHFTFSFTLLHSTCEPYVLRFTTCCQIRGNEEAVMFSFTRMSSAWGALSHVMGVGLAPDVAAVVVGAYCVHLSPLPPYHLPN